MVFDRGDRSVAIPDIVLRRNSRFDTVDWILKVSWGLLDILLSSPVHRAALRSHLALLANSPIKSWEEVKIKTFNEYPMLSKVQ